MAKEEKKKAKQRIRVATNGGPTADQKKAAKKARAAKAEDMKPKKAAEKAAEKKDEKKDEKKTEGGDK